MPFTLRSFRNFRRRTSVSLCAALFAVAGTPAAFAQDDASAGSGTEDAKPTLIDSESFKAEGEAGFAEVVVEAEELVELAEEEAGYTGPNRVAKITLSGPMLDRTDAGNSSFLFAAELEPALRDHVATFEAIAGGDIEAEGVLIHLESAWMGLSQAHELGAAIGKVSDAGIPVHIFADAYGPIEFVLGSYADELILQQGGSVMLPGLYVEELYLADALAWAGLQMDFVQIGDYKGAVETIANAQPSQTWNESIDTLLDGLYASLREPIMAGREMTEAELDKAMAESVFASGASAVASGLVDAQVDIIDLDAHLEETHGSDYAYLDDVKSPTQAAAPAPGVNSFFQMFANLQRAMNEELTPQTRRQSIAVIHIDGPIVDGESDHGSIMSSSSSVGSSTIRRALTAIEDDPNVLGVVIRVDSPGGSATASEVIWQGFDKLSELNVPIYTSVGSMAASGGYYIAVAGEQIFVTPSSIVGSIGVVGAKMVTGEMYDKLRINTVSRTRGPMAGVFGNTTRPWNTAERELIAMRMTETYDLFTDRVTAGRPGIDLSKTAEGRLFAGEQAVALNMADEIGGLNAAIAAMAGELDLQAGDYDIIDYPAPPSFEELLERSFMLSAPGSVEAQRQLKLAMFAEVGRAALGEQAWEQVAQSMRAMLEARQDPVLLISPRVLVTP